MANTLTQILNMARHELLDMGLRANPMLNFVAGMRSLEIVDEQAEQVFELLVSQGKSMSCLALPEVYQQQETPAEAKKELATDIEQDESQEAEQNTQESELEAEPDIPLPPLDVYLAEQEGDERHQDLRLQTALTTAQLDQRLLRVEYEAHTLLQEQGVDVLYLALGFLEWFESDDSDKPRYAPLILVPVELTRTSARERFYIRYSDVELGDNLALAAKLKSDFQLNLPCFDEEQSLSQYFEQVKNSIASQPRWKLHINKIALGLFSFGKFQMYQDLDANVWPEHKKPQDHPLLQQLFEQGYGATEVNDSVALDLTPLAEPERLHLVKDADVSQTEAILAAMQGANLVIEGPPGTGKSQTIANMIAEAIGRGKSVLFVAQKQAALEVVKRRLDECQLGSSVLELHSHKSTRKAVIASFKEALEQIPPSVKSIESEQQRLVDIRTRLNNYAASIRQNILHSELNYTDALGRYSFMKRQLDSIELADIDASHLITLDAESFAALKLKVEEWCSHLANLSSPLASHAFADSERLKVTPQDIDKIRELQVQVELTLQVILRTSEQLVQPVQLPQPRTLKGIKKAIGIVQRMLDAPPLDGLSITHEAWSTKAESIQQAMMAGVRCSELLNVHQERFIDAAFNTDLIAIRGGLIGRVDKWWRILSGDYRRAKNSLGALLKQGLQGQPTEWLQWVDELLELQTHRQTLSSFDALGKELFGSHWKGESSNWQSLQTQSEWLIQVFAEQNNKSLPAHFVKCLSQQPDLSNSPEEIKILKEKLVSFSELMTSMLASLQWSQNHNCHDIARYPLKQWQQLIVGWQQSERLYEIVRYNELAQNLSEHQQSSLVQLARGWQHSPKLLLSLWLCHYYRALLDYAYQEHPAIQSFDASHHEQLKAEFNSLDKAVFDWAQQRLLQQRHQAVQIDNLDGHAMDILQKELHKKSRHKAIRRLIEEVPELIQTIKPVVMMSPMSIATYLPQGAIEFDMVIFDEASQIPAVDALGAILRGKQIIVVGDNKQMPPTQFFHRAIELDDDEMEQSATSHVESILAMMESRGVTQKMLRWHYRSMHDSLIRTSNHLFYQDQLLVFPSPGLHPHAKGLNFEKVEEGYYDRGGSRTNLKEAETIAERIIQHAKQTPELSLGVVAFSSAQRDAIILQLEKLRRSNIETEAFFQHKNSDEFFVKNLENVQGDERDVIFISVGYGRTQAGNLSQNFGPVNQQGGERRLNVLITRARMAMTVFANFTADELKTTATSPAGVKALKTFLTYAETRQLPIVQETGKELDSPFEQEVKHAIEQLGYEVEPQLGSAGYYIDLAVRDPNKPGRYLLAVECDGASYHSSATARERDRLRQGVLEGLGWRFHRVWSTDWFRHQASCIERLHESIKNAEAYYLHLDGESQSDEQAESTEEDLGLEV
ncbi:DUF4011 domain-containing protein [Pleionea sp. CnH1-48]|uniref:DUF4011 domain-containing protein n=1 Tax=Pleionea sp. CnH1-48 TaxID=2954494 RepID=UPI0020970251|nr:DUF4011 domain-containing protein [Pleionea sp. CnH1-48]MCO7223569.1 DUF4011 domain-containing protein [Pleionea sp. CnH1-48]